MRTFNEYGSYLKTLIRLYRRSKHFPFLESVFLYGNKRILQYYFFVRLKKEDSMLERVVPL